MATINFPLNTEKSIRMMESDNTLVFVVDRKATKADIKAAIETQLGAKVAGVRTNTVLGGTKKAYVRFTAETPAIDVATKLGMI
jgi:large subunit ribosomal protein L23